MMSDTALHTLNSLGFAKPPAETRVVVAMSGGVDSSVVAALLHEQGYDVIGVTLQLYDHGMALEKKGACCAGQDIYDARRVAEERGFPHYVLNYENKFKDSVIEEFADSYLRGETPVPCISCNQSVKFRDLLDVAKDLGADCMATGHYIQRVMNEDAARAELHRAVDTTKDQSYFLFATTQEQLDYLRFPLGGWTKDITRDHAQRLGLITADKPDSQDICFVPGGDYTKVVKGLRPEAGKAGEIVHLDGRVLGTHDGIIGYTIGQRKGLGIGGGHSDENSPLYVIKLDAPAARVIVGPKEALACDTIFLKNCSWLDTNAATVTLKFRSMMQPVTAQVARHEDGSATLTLSAPQYGIAPGQAAACYLENRMIGGGWITATQNTALALAA
jgi:tRNA-specific 2-thiouridylase